MGEDQRFRQIVRNLADRNPYDQEGVCALCGGEPRMHMHDDHFSVEDLPETHTFNCPWRLAHQLLGTDRNFVTREDAIRMDPRVNADGNLLSPQPKGSTGEVRMEGAE